MDPPSPSGALVALGPVDPEWQPILHVSNQVVLYNPTSHAISIQTHSRPSSRSLTHAGRCPYCHRALAGEVGHDEDDAFETEVEDIERNSNRAPNYFHLLEVANESSRPASPESIAGSSASDASAGPSAFRADNMAEGYFKAFFQEVCRLGMGANGSVYLCQHMLDGNSLGYFAVKKVAVGQSHTYLLNTLREVRLLEKLQHPNIITYHHAWLESSQFSSFGPRIPTLHILMQWAEGGSLDDFIDVRLGRRAPNLPLHPSGPSSNDSQTSPSPSTVPSPPEHMYSRSARIRAFRALQRAPPEERERLRREMGLNGNGAQAQGAAKTPADYKAVHLLSAEEVQGLFSDVVSGLAFLHEKSILHLDLKPGNVLLTWDEGRLIPRAMLSDFGTSQDMLNARTRSGNTGTLEYAAPESLPSPTTGKLLQVDSKADMWSLGMILHKLLFFRLPYHYSSDSENPSRPTDGKDFADRLEDEILRYRGFKSSSALVTTFESRRLPRAYLYLLENLLHVKPGTRPSSERVLGAIKEGGLKPVNLARRPEAGSSTMALARPHHRISPERIHNGYPTTIQEQSDSNVEEIDEEDEVSSEDEKTPLLGLPEPEPTQSPTPEGWSHTLRLWGWRVPARLPRAIWVRTLKSSILVGKVLSLSRVCPGTTPQPVVTGAALALAVMDTWFDGLGATLLLGAGHVALLSLACWTGECCE